MMAERERRGEIEFLAKHGVIVEDADTPPR